MCGGVRNTVNTWGILKKEDESQQERPPLDSAAI